MENDLYIVVPKPDYGSKTNKRNKGAMLVAYEDLKQYAGMQDIFVYRVTSMVRLKVGTTLEEAP